MSDLNLSDVADRLLGDTPKANTDVGNTTDDAATTATVKPAASTSTNVNTDAMATDDADEVEILWVSETMTPFSPSRVKQEPSTPLARVRPQETSTIPSMTPLIKALPTMSTPIGTAMTQSLDIPMIDVGIPTPAVGETAMDVHMDLPHTPITNRTTAAVEFLGRAADTRNTATPAASGAGHSNQLPPTTASSNTSDASTTGAAASSTTLSTTTNAVAATFTAPAAVPPPRARAANVAVTSAAATTITAPAAIPQPRAGAANVAATSAATATIRAPAANPPPRARAANAAARPPLQARARNLARGARQRARPRTAAQRHNAYNHVQIRDDAPEVVRLSHAVQRDARVCGIEIPELAIRDFFNHWRHQTSHYYRR